MSLTKSEKASEEVFPVRVSTMNTVLEFYLGPECTGRNLFDLVCRNIGLLEVWYFGLKYVNSEGFYAWLNHDEKIRDQDIKKKEPVECVFLAKFYPKDLAKEVVQEITQHLFFLQLKKGILNMEIYCPYEVFALLASYAVQAKYGDHHEVTYTPDMLAKEHLLPHQVVNQDNFDWWVERINISYLKHRGMSRNKAEMEYLKIVQDLDMYGVNYFPITNEKEKEFWLGVTALGLNIYERNEKLTPKVTFLWSEMRKISVANIKFTIELVGYSETIQFYTLSISVSKLIYDLYFGNIDFFIWQRKLDSMEMQQMPDQAKSEKTQRLFLQYKLEREKQLREKVKKEKAELEHKMMQYQEQENITLTGLRRCKEAVERLAERARIAEEEAEIRVKISAIKTEEEKKVMEKKVHEVELLATKMIQEFERAAKEVERLKEELSKAKIPEKDSKEEFKK